MSTINDFHSFEFQFFPKKNFLTVFDQTLLIHMWPYIGNIGLAKVRIRVAYLWGMRNDVYYLRYVQHTRISEWDLEHDLCPYSVQVQYSNNPAPIHAVARISCRHCEKIFNIGIIFLHFYKMFYIGKTSWNIKH